MDTEIQTLKRITDDLLMRVELLETRISMWEDYVRDQEAQKEVAGDPDAKRSFRHA